MTHRYDTGTTDTLGRPIRRHRTTPARERVLAFLRRHIAEQGYAPTIREVCAELDLAPGTVHGILTRLEREGHIERPPCGHSSARARAIRVLT